MFPIGALVTYRSTSGRVRCRVVDIIPEPDRRYYALIVTARTSARYPLGTEILVSEGSPDLASTVKHLR